MSRSSASRWLVLLALVLLLALFAAIVLLYLNYIGGRALHSRPIVRVTDIYPGADVAVVGQPVVVFGAAHDPEGVERAEIWVNGEKVSDQDNPEPRLTIDWNLSGAWIPDDPGDYLVFLRAIDLEGMVGESEPVLVTVSEKSASPDPAATTQYVLQPGETIESVAARFGLDPDEIRALNPDIGVAGAGTALILPLPSIASEQESPGSEAGGVQHVRNSPPAGPGAAGTPAETTEPPSVPDDPLLRALFCMMQPDYCRPVSERIAPPLAPDQVSATAQDACQSVIAWRDNSEDEVGFLVYRLTLRPRWRMELIETASAAPGTGTRLQVTDARVPFGEHLYSVRAFNEAGETWGNPSSRLESDCPAIEPLNPELETLGIEALSFATPDAFDRLYCYVALAGAPFERVPAAPTDFIAFEGGGWDIAGHMGGANTRTLQHNAAIPLTLDASCLGWQGGTLVELGRFHREHPPTEWDGQPITAGPDDGGFSVTYRVFRTVAMDDDVHTILLPIIDASVPPPFNVRLSAISVTYNPGTDDDSDIGTTGQYSVPALAWDYAVDPTNPRPPLGFRVYRFINGAPDGEEVAITDASTQITRIETDCTRTLSYQVVAVVGQDPLTGDDITSPPSESFVAPSTCQALMITIDSFVSERTASAYGWFRFNGKKFIWNPHCDTGFGGACLSRGPNVTVVHAGESIGGSDMFLFSTPGGGFRQNNQYLRIPIHSGEPLRLDLAVFNHQDILDDDLWCSGIQTVVLASSLAEWRSFTPRIIDADFGNCTLNFIVAPVP